MLFNPGKRRMRQTAALLLVSLAASCALAQNRATTLVVPYTPGSGPDAVARIIAPKLAALIGGPVVIDNRAGASGNIGADFVAKAKPDGATLMVTVNTFNVTPALYKKLPYDPLADFSPITKLGVSNLALVINANVPAQNFESFITLAKAKPGTVNYGSAGSGTTQHLAMEVLKKRYGLDMLHVPYKGATGATTDLISGQVQASMMPVHTAMPFVRSGKLRMLAVARETRSPFAPDVPSFGELGAGNLDLAVTFWVSGPAGMPADLVARLNRDMGTVLAMPDVREQFAVQGITPELSTPAQLGDFIKREIDRWKRFVAEQNIVLD